MTGQGPTAARGMGLTPKQSELLAYIERHVAKRGRAPSYRQMARDLGRSLQGLYDTVSGLVERCRLRRSWGRLELVAPCLRPVFPPGHWEERARLKRAQYAREAGVFSDPRLALLAREV